MYVNGIIAEYNPFHNGHEYQLRESLRLTKASRTIVVMSGNFVQRGAPALMPKHLRAEAALRCGADLILELPVLYATAGADYFAAGATALLDSLNTVTHVCFGSECGDVGLLRQAARLLATESGEYRTALKQGLKQGLSYPAAGARALSECGLLPAGSGELFSTPNNILGINYIRALERRQSAMIPVTVRRLGDGYHDAMTPDSALLPCSAFAIRHALCEGRAPAALLPHMPHEAAALLEAYSASGSFVYPDDFSELLRYRLLTEKERGYEKYLDVTPELSNRIRNRLHEFTGFEAFCSLLKTKNLTYTRISRCLLHILLGVEQSHMELRKASGHVPPYARVLGFRRSAIPLLGVIKRNSPIPLITKVADAKRSLPADACRLLDQDILAGEIYGIASCRGSGRPVPNEISTPPVIL